MTISSFISHKPKSITMPHGNGRHDKPSASSKSGGEVAFRIFVSLVLVGILAVQIVIVSGGGATNTIMARAEGLLKRYPSEQFETTAHQLVKTIENLHKASARADILMDHLDTKKVDELIQSARAIEESLKNLHEIRLKVS